MTVTVQQYRSTSPALVSTPTDLAAVEAASQPLDAELTAIAALIPSGQQVPMFGGPGIATLASVSDAALTILDDASVEAILTTLGGGARQGSGVLVGATSPTLTTPNVGAATGTSLAATGAIASSSATAGVGYATGAGTAVTQNTNKGTAVTLNAMCGEITLNNASLSSADEVVFTVNCTSVKIQDAIFVCHQSAGTFGAYSVHAGNIVNDTSFQISVGNMSAGPLSEAIVLNYVIIRGVKT